MDIEHIQARPRPCRRRCPPPPRCSTQSWTTDVLRQRRAAGPGPSTVPARTLVLVHGLGGTADGIWRGQVPDAGPTSAWWPTTCAAPVASEVPAGPYTIDVLVDDLPPWWTSSRAGGGSPDGALHGRLDRARLRRPASRTGVSAVGLEGAPIAAPAAATGWRQGRGPYRRRACPRSPRPWPPTAPHRPSASGAAGRFERLRRACSRPAKPTGYAAQCRALVGLDLGAELGPHHGPALLLAPGDQRRRGPARVTGANAAPHPRRAGRDRQRHPPTSSRWERPAEVERLAVPFLREHARAATTG